MLKTFDQEVKLIGTGFVGVSGEFKHLIQVYNSDLYKIKAETN